MLLLYFQIAKIVVQKQQKGDSHVKKRTAITAAITTEPPEVTVSARVPVAKT